MDVLLNNPVSHGYLSNEVPHHVRGRLWVIGCTEPVTIELRGNFLRDIAGTRISFFNPFPEPSLEDTLVLRPHQTGVAGEMSASRRVSQLWQRSCRPSHPCFNFDNNTLKNMLLLEWFNPEGQRVLIRACHWQVGVSDRRWELTEAQEMAHIRATRIQRRRFLLTREGR